MKQKKIYRTEYGGYTLHGNFKFEWSDYERERKRSDGEWYCISCNIRAEVKGNKVSCPNCKSVSTYSVE